MKVRKSEHIPIFNLLRALAALGVCLIHLHYEVGLNRYPINKIITHGQQGVAIFFVVSGFIIPYSLWNSDYKVKYFFSYIFRRSVRIDPPYLLIILICLLTGYKFDLLKIIYHLFYLIPFSNQNWYQGVFWTLGVEFQFYILIGLLFPLLKNSNSNLIIGCLVLIGITGYFIPYPKNFGFIFHHAHYFSFGIITLLAWKKRIPIFTAQMSMLFLALFLTFTVSINCGFVGFIVAQAILYLKFENPITNFLGKISYSLYLTHSLTAEFLGKLLKPYAINPYVLFGIMIVCSILLAFIFYFFMERVALNWSKRIKIGGKKDERRLIIYFRQEKERDRIIPGDGYLIPLLRRLIKGKKISGIGKVFLNLRRSFDLLGIKYHINVPFKQIRPNDRLIVLGLGRYALKGYNKPNKIVAGIALMTHPSEWPDLCEVYPIAKYLQHSEWAKNTYAPYYGESICDTWFAGIDTEHWKPLNQEKKIDILIYNKVKWKYDDELRMPILERLRNLGLTYQEINYGKYNEQEYRELLNSCSAMIFLAEHESQGFACCEAMSMNVPILAWDQGFCLDPNRFDWGDPVIPASSVPFFDETCGMKFKDFNEFDKQVESFMENVKTNTYKPREFILNNLTLEKSGERMLEILNEVYP
jgi:peptidoglycan/LPS O-acetylase OafA/YrhL